MDTTNSSSIGPVQTAIRFASWLIGSHFASARILLRKLQESNPYDHELRSPEEIRRIFELLDNVNTAAERGDTFKFGMQVGKLLALGWVLGEVPSSDLSLNYEFEDWNAT